MGNFYYNLHGGLNTQLTPIKLGADNNKLYWAEAFNVEPYKNQGVTRQKGNRIIFETTAKISGASDGSEGAFNTVGVIEYPKGSKNFVLGLSDGRIFHFDANSGILKLIWDFKQAATPSKSGFEITKYLFEYFLDGLVIIPLCASNCAIDGIFYNPEYKISISNLNLPEADGEWILATAVCQYAGRLWIASGSTLYYSALGCFDDWTTSHDAGYISNFHSSTAKITALKEYGGSLAIYKMFEVFLLSGSDPESFAISKFADKGAAGCYSVLTCNNKQYFFNDCGLFSLSYVGELAQIVMSTNYAKNIAKLFEKLDKSRIQDTIMLVLELKNQIWIFPPIADEKGKKEVWIFDWALEAWFIRIIPYEITFAAGVLGNIYTVSPDGPGDCRECIFVENKGNTFASKPIKFKFSTPFFNFSKPSERKIIEDAQIICDGASENNFDFFISTDYISENVTLPEKIYLDIPNVLVWAGSEDEKSLNCWAEKNSGGIWSDFVQEEIKLDIFEANKAVQLHFGGNEAGSDLTIIGIEFKGIIYEG